MTLLGLKLMCSLISHVATDDPIAHSLAPRLHKKTRVFVTDAIMCDCAEDCREVCGGEAALK